MKIVIKNILRIILLNVGVWIILDLANIELPVILYNVGLVVGCIGTNLTNN